MKMFTSLPKNTDFYHRYAGIIPTLHRSGYLAQVISFMTEIGIIYSILYQSVIDFAPNYAQEIAYFGAFIGAGFIEIALRKFLPYSVRQILHKRYVGLDKVMTIFIFSGTLLLIVTSGFLSFKGSKDLVEWAAPEPVVKTTHSIDSIALSRKTEAAVIYQRDSIAREEQYQSLLNAAATRLKGYEEKEVRTGRNYTSRKQRIREEISSIEKEKAAALGKAWNAYKSAQETIRLKKDTSIARVELINITTSNKAISKIKNYGGGLGWFTIICLTVLIISVVLYEVYRKGSDIEEKARPSQYAFLPSVWLEAKGAIAERINYLFRNKITSFADATPPPPLPASIKSHYDQSHLSLYGITVKSKNGEDQVIHLPVQKHEQNKVSTTVATDDLATKALDYTAAAVQLESVNLHSQANEMFLKAEEVLKMYLGSGATEATVLELKTACIAHLNNDGPNPFSHHHRRPIGYGSTTENNGRYNGPVSDGKIMADGSLKNCPSNDQVSSRETVIDSSLKSCNHCNKQYKPKAWNQKYCSTDCKKDYHTDKHGGQPFNPRKFHGKKP